MVSILSTPPFIKISKDIMSSNSNKKNKKDVENLYTEKNQFNYHNQKESKLHHHLKDYITNVSGS